MGTHEYEDDPRNSEVIISVNGDLVHRSEAKISVFDAGFLLGDGVWESFRLHNGHLVFKYSKLKGRRPTLASSWKKLVTSSPSLMVETGWS